MGGATLRWMTITAVSLLSLLRPTLQCGGGGGGDGGLADAQRESRAQELKLWCHSNCVEHWTGWGPCSKNCAGGSQIRTRAPATHTYCEQVPDFTCTMSKTDTRPCNEACPYGVPVNGVCRCPNGRNGECCENEISCEYPTRPMHGRVEGTWPARVGSIAEFTCMEGFTLVGEDIRHCQRSGQWTAENPICQRIMCRTPTYGAHVILLNANPAGYVYGEHAVFMCERGFELVGPESRECREFNATGGRWTGFSPRCDPIQCPDPGIPINGDRDGTDLSFMSTVTFSCHAGYRLVGSTTLQCLASQTWFGHIPTCEQIQCEAPYVAEHGSVRVRRSPLGSQAIFSCEPGYIVSGPRILQCLESGFWNDTEPECEAVDCGDPGQPENGYKDGIMYTYPWEVTYSCHRGYTRVGRESIGCMPDGRWSGEPPLCQACPLNTWAAANGTCVSCPANSHTLTEASTSPQLCMCDYGFTGVPGGECLEVRCADETSPENGAMSSCNTLAGGTCNFTCNDGYVVERGTTTRVCQENGVWNGEKPLCAPCEMNTYKSSERGCTSCPENSETDSPAQMREGCLCRTGFQGEPGGPCVDVDECLTNDGRGPCEDTCENNIGSYRCRCLTPGFINDPDDFHLCFPEHQCKNITEDEAPRHGGMVCHWYNQQNSIFCGVRCNPGYEHPAKVNDYETCGPVTNYEWSFRIKKNDPDAVFPSCVKAFFPGITLEAETAYFTSNCNDLTEDEKLAVKEEFANMLNEQNVCMKSSTQLCQIKDMGIICGRTTRRRKRDLTWEDVSEVDLALNISALTIITEKEQCNQTMCQFLRIPPPECDQLCVPAYNRFIKAAVMYAERQLTALYSDPARLRQMVLNAANRVFQPKNAGENLWTSGVQEECEEGMELGEGSCRPCEIGTALDLVNKTCIACPIGTYQNQERQTECIPCPVGSTTNIVGSKTCFVCEKGWFGQGCLQRCSCAHGICDPFTGTCNCDSGWEGEHCSVDTPGCRQGGCFPGVQCSDVPAPGTGFTCGNCPDGYQGDGATCLPVGQSGIAANLLDIHK